MKSRSHLELRIYLKSRGKHQLDVRVWFNKAVTRDGLLFLFPRSMEIPLDIVDHTFSFLISDKDSLIRCSEAHPVFSRMVEKYQYYHINLHAHGHISSYFTKLLSDKPRIGAYVHVLQLQLYRGLMPLLEEMVAILPMFPALECIVLSTTLKKISWQEDIPQRFRKALEDCLRLPTLQEVHMCCWDFPLSTLDNHPNIQYLAFSGTTQFSELADTTHPHLKFLSVENFYQPDDLTISSIWAEKHTTKLQSLKYDYSSNAPILELLKYCSDTLSNLDLTLTGYKQAGCESEFLIFGLLLNTSQLPQDMTSRGDIIVYAPTSRHP
jgi:hypothetical protein